MTMTFDQAKDSLLSCMIGVISTCDLIVMKENLETYPNKSSEEFYERSIEEHCKMVIYNNPYKH